MAKYDQYHHLSDAEFVAMFADQCEASPIISSLVKRLQEAQAKRNNRTSDISDDLRCPVCCAPVTATLKSESDFIKLKRA
jgi:cytochrome c-type biogenesis protein CcmH/NrfF